MKRLMAIAVAAFALLGADGRDTAIYNGKLTSAMNANGMAITNAPTPVRDGDLANKAYVDGIGGVTPGTVTNIANARIDAKVAPWAMSGQPRPEGMTTNAVRDIVATIPLVRTNDTGIIQSAKITTAQVVDVPGLCFTAGATNSTITMIKNGSPPDISLEYTTDGTTWHTFVSNSIARTVTLTNVGDRVWIRATDGGNENIGIDYINYWKFVMEGSVSASSSIEYLRNKEGAITTSETGRYCCLFTNCTSLTESPALTAKNLSINCYGKMFCDCTALKEAPALKATTLADHCYAGMFFGCTALTNAPALPATTLASFCYKSMFYGCTALTNAPALPATTLAYGCYGFMFSYCTALKSAPALPVMTLADSCYYYMFSGCTSLTDAPALPATTMADRCYCGMFKGCTSLKISQTKINEYMTPFRIPSSCDAVSVGEDSMLKMFEGTGGTFTGTPTTNVTYYGAWDASPYVTSNTVNRMISDKADLAVPSASGNFAALTSSGNLADSGYKYNTLPYRSSSWVPSWSQVTSKPSWIGSTKPTYTYDEVGAAPAVEGGYLPRSAGSSYPLTDLLYFDWYCRVGINNSRMTISGTRQGSYNNEICFKDFYDDKESILTIDNTDIMTEGKADFHIVSNATSVTSGQIADYDLTGLTTKTITVLFDSGMKSGDALIWTAGNAADCEITFSITGYTQIGDTGYATATAGKKCLFSIVKVSPNEVIISKKEY